MEDQVRRRLANFLVLFPGHTAVNIHDMTYGDWEQLAGATDEHIAHTKEQATRARSRR